MKSNKIDSQKVALSWFEIWLGCIAFGLVFIPPLHLAGKNIFAAEWMFVPVFIVFAILLFQKKISTPPKELIFLWGGLFLAVFAGRWRGDLAYDFSQYKQFVSVEELRFSWAQDGIRCIRWAVIFSTPWILSHFETQNKTKWHFFLKVLRHCVLGSAILAILNKLDIIYLGGFYGTEGGGNVWVGRSYGTFQSPLEASLIYAAFLAQNLCILFNHKNKNMKYEIFQNFILFSALLLTHGLTALVACAIAVLYRSMVLPARIRQYFIVAIGLAFFFLLVFDKDGNMVMNKLNNFSVRLQTLVDWISAIPNNPHILFFGLGFSNLVIDNSFMITLINGGLCLFIPWLLWIRKIIKFIPKEMLPFFVVWIVSWLTLDSMGYWGIGRIAWIFLGLFYGKEISNSIKSQSRSN